MNVAFLGIDSLQVKWNNEDSFLNVAHKDPKVELEEQLKEVLLNEIIYANLLKIKMKSQK